MLARCDLCTELFMIHIRERVVDDGVVQEFECPHCLHIFTVAYMTERALKLRQTIQCYRTLPLDEKNMKRIDRAVRELKTQVLPPEHR